MKLCTDGDEFVLTALRPEREAQRRPGRGSAARPRPTERSPGRSCKLLEQGVSHLPEPFRIAFALREVEAVGVEKTAAPLDRILATVKTRHLRARRRLRKALEPVLDSALGGSFVFAGADCARTTERIAAAFEAARGGR